MWEQGLFSSHCVLLSHIHTGLYCSRPLMLLKLIKTVYTIRHENLKLSWHPIYKNSMEKILRLSKNNDISNLSKNAY